ncbi:PREDICTED: uncharacterized protein LOC108567333 [Nicrophorus vespilloides]|uniref:Uncharacterized protein LOC108567333 n=1 Tax=Nicrophorus vespilloides TaxID=110193 RepID=A0ABM1N8R9_NICVS|nr:PREDICTED: uncharacterized protein LOC108567333 [Nicrophorus vespilloides]
MASVGFRWLDILEKEFDKGFVDLDLTIGELDSEEPDVVYNVRQKLCTLSSCFAQLTHKATTIFQNSAKIEAELIHMRAELVESKSRREILEQELHNLLLQLHSNQLSKLPKPNGNFKQDPNFKPDVNNIKRKLEDEIRRSPSHMKCSNNSTDVDDIEFNESTVELKKLRAENGQLHAENVTLRNNVLALNSEVYGAKLAAKYLDKELAGRIQQLQLLGREMRGDVRDKLWRQLESEILLQRHKTVVRECRRNSVMNGSDKNNGIKVNSEVVIPSIAERTENFGDVRTVVVKRKPGQGLGISITGGREHGVPILISELEPNGPAAVSGQLYIGDAILSVNERDLRQACHKEAVDILKQNSEECRLQVQYIAVDDSDNSLEEEGFHFRFFDGEVCDSNDGINTLPSNPAIINTPTAPRTPESTCQSGGTSRIITDGALTMSEDPAKQFQVSPEIQKVIDSLQTNFNNSNDILTGNEMHYLDANNEINRNTSKFSNGDLILLDNLNDNYKKVDNTLNCSSNSLNSENLSSPMQTSTDMFLDSEVLSTDVASNDSQSPKDITKFTYIPEAKYEEEYASNDTTKSDQSLLNSSCDSSPVHKQSRDYKKSKKYKTKKYFGVKTLQSIFNKHDGYSDISSAASDVPEELPKEEVKEAEGEEEEEPKFKYKTITETSPQFEENIHNFLSDIFMKNFQTPDTPDANAATSKMGTKRYLRVGKALRLCPNEETVNISEYEQRREKLLARYVYNSNSLSADGEGNPDFGTPV